MKIAIWMLLAAVLLIVAGALLSRGKRRTPDWLPPELAAAKIYAIEKLFSATVGDFDVVAKPDRIYKLASGKLCVTDFKTRANVDAVYPGDIWQISAGAGVLSAIGKRVSAYGWVIVEDRKSGKRKCHRVTLLQGDALQQVLGRYDAVRSGRCEARRAASKRQCAKCEYSGCC